MSVDVPDPASSRAPWRIYNIGNSPSVELTEVVRVIEQIVGKPAIRELLPMQPGGCAGSRVHKLRDIENSQKGELG